MAPGTIRRRPRSFGLARLFCPPARARLFAPRRMPSLARSRGFFLARWDVLVATMLGKREAAFLFWGATLASLAERRQANGAGA